MRIEVGNGIVVCDRSMLEVDTSCMQWRKDFENMPKDGTTVFVFSKFAQDFAAVYYSSNGDWIRLNSNFIIFPSDAITAYCIPTVPAWARRN